MKQVAKTAPCCADEQAVKSDSGHPKPQNRNLSVIRGGGKNFAGAPLSGVFAETQEESPFEELKLVEGKLPADFPDGTLYCSAQTRFRRDDGAVLGTVFCGDGGVTGIRFKEGRVTGSFRYILTNDIRREQEQGIRLARYGTPGSKSRYGWFGRMANLANTHLMSWNRRLFALFEGGLPTEINPEDLSTLGDTDLGAVIKQALAAHYHVHPNGDIYNFGMSHHPPFKSRITLYKFAAGATQAQKITSFKMPWTCAMHDFALSENHAFFFFGSARINIGKVALGNTIDSSLEFNKAAAQIIVIPLRDPSKNFRVDLPNDKSWIWHTVNAFEQDSQLVVDTFLYPDAEQTFLWMRHVHTATVPRLSPADIVRFVIDLKQRTVSKKTLVPESAVEFPMIGDTARCRQHRYLYSAGYSSYEVALGKGLWDQIFKFDFADLETVQKRVLSVEGAHPAEPVFVAKPDPVSEDDGYLVTRLLYPPNNPDEPTRGEVAIIDAKKFEVVTRYALKERMATMIFHGTWCEGL